MKRLLIAAFILCLGWLSGCRAQTPAGSIREAAVAGKFYSADSTKLSLGIHRYLKDAIPPRGEAPLAIVVPHAGYVYCGQIMADAFRQAEKQAYDVVIIIGTNHTLPGFEGVSVYPKGYFRTPLGKVAVDDALAKAITNADHRFTNDLRVHETEHSVEVEAPWVQTLWPQAKIVPIVVGAPDADLCATLGTTIARCVKNRRALIVASSDLSHYPRYTDARRVDGATLSAVAQMNEKLVRSTIRQSMSEQVSQLSTCACGEGPILAAIAAAHELGATHGTVISYANSGDASVGESNRVVGYGAVMFSQGSSSVDTSALTATNVSDTSATLSNEDEHALLKFSRKTIEWYLTSETVPLARGFNAVAMRKMGAFVTLKKNGELRGCIGHMAEDLPLCQTVGAMAINAAFEDRRFSPLQRDELAKVVLEISVLTPAQQVASKENITLGQDGVVLRKDGRSAVFLPQVATEQGWSRDEMLHHLCLKAGLDGDCWQNGADFSTFRAIVFSESR